MKKILNEKNFKSKTIIIDNNNENILDKILISEFPLKVK